MTLARQANGLFPTQLPRHPEIARRTSDWTEDAALERWMRHAAERSVSDAIVDLAPNLEVLAVGSRGGALAALLTPLAVVQTLVAKLLGLIRTARQGRAAMDDATEQLASLSEQAKDEGDEPPTEAALSAARRLVPEIIARHRGLLEIYPDAGGAVSIYVRSAPGEALLLTCEGNGRAVWFLTHRGTSSRWRYESAADLPDDFLVRALAVLRSQ